MNGTFPRLALGSLLLICSLSHAEICLVRAGQPLAQIVLPEKASEQLKAAAEKLAAYVQEASGARLPVTFENEWAGERRQPLIVIGPTARWKLTLPPGLDEDGFVIAAKDGVVQICGPSDWGTEFGVYEFLERYVGVRWLLPGENGTDVPALHTINIPEGRLQEQPVFFSRLLSGLRGPAQMEWARFNRMHGRVSFHHSLGEYIFKPELYTKTHPEFYPMKDGKTRYLPPDGLYHGWQPCFSEPGTVQTAIDTICAYFQAHPEATSFSLGVNDSSGHCHCPRCQAALPQEKNFLGMDDYSDLYYEWCNKVIEGVLQRFPDKWFGCLAYSEVAAPPRRLKVHERLIPYMTYDRMKWIDPEIAQAGQAATEAWHKMSPTLGWYDYIYGTPYCLPRVYFHHTARYLRYAAAHGVKAHYAEIYPNWGEGPKPYIYLKLWWDPRQDVEGLLKEWYERCVGPKAAPELAAYYAIWERFWTKDILQSKWFSKGGQYLNFYSPTYLTDVKKEDIVASRRHLEACVARCETPQQRARAELLLKAFEYYEASALAYLAHSATPAVIATEQEALQALKEAATALQMAHKRRVLALEVFPHDPVLVHPLSINNSPLSGEGWGSAGLWAVMDFALQGGAVRDKLSLLAQSATPLVAQQARLMLALADGQTEILTRNASFEEGQAPWSFWRKPENAPVGRMLLSQDIAHTGRFSLLCEGMQRGGPVYSLPFPGPGTYIALAWIYVPAEQKAPHGTVELVITPRDENGNNLPGASTKISPPPGQWKLLVAAAEIPAEIQGKPVKSLLVIPIVDAFEEGRVYIDDVSLQRLRL